jgi:hypothetical protein
MKQDAVLFLRKLLLFLLPLLLIFGYVEARLRRIPSYYATKRTHFEKQLDSLEVLVLGSSHAMDGIDPSCLSRPAFNLAAGSQSLYYDTRLVRMYIDRMPRLACVLIEITSCNLWVQVADIRESWRDYFYYRFWGIRYHGLARFDPKMLSYVALYGPDVALGYVRRNFKVKPFLVLPNGFSYSPKDTFTRFAQVTDSWGKVRAADLTARGPGHLRENIADLDTLLGELRRRHVKAAFFTTPVLDCVSRHLDPAIALRNTQIVDSLCAVYGCFYADYSLDKRFVVEDFRDGDHLNFRGAQKFSRIVNQDIIVDSVEPRARN